MSLADEDISEFVKSEMAKKLTDTPRVFGDLELGKPKVPQVDVFFFSLKICPTSVLYVTSDAFWEDILDCKEPVGLV